MGDSQLYVDREVNVSLIAADGRSTDHDAMSIPLTFADRLDEAVEALKLPSRKALVERISTVSNPKETAGQWVARTTIPHKYRKPLADLGISIDYINDGTGALAVGNGPAPASQPAGLDREMIADAVKVARLVRDNSLEPVSDDTFEEVLTIALQKVAEHGGAGDLSEMARDVATAFRSRGQVDGNKR